ncbi:hypothetical protein JCM3770_000215 [Rhodotorula araucariae]
MALAPRTATLFLVDCSASMGAKRAFTVGNGPHEVTTQRSALDVAQEYVKAKVVQRIMRDLKTTPFGVVLFGHAKTKNLLTTRAKEQAAERGDKFDRAADPYRHCYELLPLTKTIDQSLVERVDDAVAGEGPDGDAFTATILGIETLDADASLKNYAVKELCVLTDGESEVNWDGLRNAAHQMNAKGMSLTVIGIDFDDEALGFVEENKSEIKRENEARFAELVELLDQPSIIANARLALAAIATPQVKAVNSRADRMVLTFGNPTAHPDSSLTMHIDVKKAVVPAAAPTMKQMSMRGFQRVRTQRAAQQSQAQSQGFSQLFGGNSDSQTAPRGTKRGSDAVGRDEEEADDDLKDEVKRKARFAEQQNREHQAQMAAGQGIELGKIGVPFDRALQNEGLAVGTDEDADLAGHGVTKETRYFYRPAPKPPAAKDAKAKNGSSQVNVSKRPHDGGTVEEDAIDESDEEELRIVDETETELTNAYHYGGSLVPTGDLEDDAGMLAGQKTGMEILHFMKESDFHYDWRMGDVFYVLATRGELGSEKLFSALVNGMSERDTLAIVRFVKKGYTRNGVARVPDPMLGVLFPHTTDDNKEFCYWVRIPFAEDIRSITFPSLTRLFNRKGLPLKEHKLLPTEEMDNAMGAFVDSMDLTQAGPPDEEGNPTEFFTTEDSFSPAIHNIQNTLVFRLSNPDADLPPVPPVLTKYMDPPPSIADGSAAAADKVKRVFDVQIVPPKPKKVNKKTAQYAQAGLEDEIQLDRIFGSQAGAAVEKVEAKTAPPVHATESSKPVKMDVSAEDDDIIFVDADDTKPSKGTAAAADDDVEDEPDTEEEPDTEAEDEDGNENARVRAASGDVKAAFAAAASAIEKSFSHSRYAMASEELTTARNLAQRTGAESIYNASLRALAASLRTNPKKRDYLSRVRTDGIGLLVGGDTLPQEAEDFLDELDA